MTTRIQTFDGNIGIGTNDPGAYKLRVDGAVRANSLEINGVTNAQVPSGLIAMWSGAVANIPDGWVLCDGNNGTPNLVGRFVRGADGDAPSPVAVGGAAGANTVTLAEGNLPAHAHPFTGDDASAPHNHNTNTANAPHGHNTAAANAPHGHNTNTANAPHRHSIAYNNVATYSPVAIFTEINRSPNGNADSNYANAPHNHGINAANAPHSHGVNTANAPHNHGINTVNAPHSHTGTVGQTGSGQAVTVTNPYYVLAYIMKI